MKPAAGLAIALLAIAAPAGCGGADAETTAPVQTDDPATAFAPLVELDARERSLPMSAGRFLHNSGLEWGGGPCPLDVDFAAGPASRPLVGSPVPALDPRRLAREPAYRTRPRKKGCRSGFRDDLFTAAQHTRPFDNKDRPPGLYLNEGFTLDILSDHQAGTKRLASDGSLAGVETYYAIEKRAVDGRPGVRISYWLLFGRGRATVPTSGKRVTHEGDWERIDVLAVGGGKRDAYTPVATRFRIGKRFETVAWEDTKLNGATHPVAYLALGSHTPRPRPGDDSAERLPWKTWRELRDVRREPWFGYGGGWGAIGDSDAETGPLGPSPFELESLRKVAEDWV